MNVDPAGVTAALPGDAPAVAANETVGKYRLDKPLGAGGMGIVWAAFDPDLERAVALKLLRAEATEQASMRTRLLREARAMARLRHPNVVTVFDVGTDKGRDYIAMELVEGGTLDEWLQTKPARSAIIEALLAAGRGLAAAHAAGLVHRDFKPHNVLRASDGHIYVTDFGLARGQIEDGPELVAIALPLEEPASGSQPRRKRDLVLDSPLTQTGVLIGTPAYMAPEQFAGATPDPKSDQFAFCVTAWQALTGERPFRGESLTQIEAAARAGAAKLDANIEPALRSVLERGLESQPAARYPDMTTLLDALAAAAKPVPKKRRWLIPVLAGSVLAGGGVVVAIAASQQNQQVEDDCIDPEEAFARVWGDDQRSGLSGAQGIAMVGLVDKTRKGWTKSYAAACTGDRTPEKQRRIRCLLDARDSIADTIRGMRSEQNFNWQQLGTLAMSVAVCDPDVMRDFGNDVDPDDFEVPDIDLDLEQPTPPVPPAPPPPRP
jgi:tRNA A-37 threonylcarbamoyl transferase component Bud32